MARNGIEKIKPHERVKRGGLSGAERQQAYKMRFIAEHGLQAWKDRRNKCRQ